ncbi:hypothetical protein GRF29_1g1765516 [Pseudopithomyces chartarum]|uniref:Uncharacterized protein n=1 Tax=Pseudopithomyces chartarum TaxID=1892770 RepID=A0AAN6RM64_9PLEO|nr:hypothetical protein GRF29_1g1765516 [Pseudopithomyces chartarum]
MQFTIATVALFASTVLALPAPAPVSTSATISFINDQSGAHYPVIAPLDGSVIRLCDVLTDSTISGPNGIQASSAQLIAYPQNVDCVISGSSGTTLGELTATRTYEKLNKLAQGVALVDLNGASIQCTNGGKVYREE